MADIEKVIKGLECCLRESEHIDDNPCADCPYYDIDSGVGGKCIDDKDRDALELLKSKPDIDKIVKELDDTSKRYEPRPFESINWMLRYEGIMIGLEIAQYVVKGEPIPDKF